jgi:hypothetical protein
MVDPASQERAPQLDVMGPLITRAIQEKCTQMVGSISFAISFSFAIVAIKSALESKQTDMLLLAGSCGAIVVLLTAIEIWSEVVTGTTGRGGLSGLCVSIVSGINMVLLHIMSNAISSHATTITPPATDMISLTMAAFIGGSMVWLIGGTISPR